MEFQTAENTVIPHLNQSLAELNKSIDNILAAIEQGIFTQSTKQRLEELESKKKDIEIEIAKESIRRPLLNEDQVRFWFERLRNLNINELSHRKRLIDTFLNSVFVYDDKLLINCNYPNTSTIVRFSDINATLNGSDILACGRPNFVPYALKISPFRKIGTGFLFIIPNLLFCQKTIAFSKTLSFGTRHRFRALFAFIFLVLFQNPLSLPTASQILRADDFVSPLRYLFL